MKTNVFMGNVPVSAEINEQMEPSSVEDFFTDALAGHVKKCWTMSKQAKIPVTERLLKCERQRRGVYDPDKAHQISQTGGSDIYMMLTDIKCRAANSWIKDVLNSSYGKIFDLEPAKEPSLPPEIMASIGDLVRMEAEQFLAEGQSIHPETFRVRMAEVHDEVRMRILEEAKDSAKRHTYVIEDQFKEGGYDRSFTEFLEDYVTFPTAILKAPMVKRKKRLIWGENYIPVVVSDFVRAVERVSPYDMYPAPNSDGPNDAWLIERHRLYRNDLEEMMGVPGYSDSNLRAAIDQYGTSGLRYMELGDQQRNLLSGKFNTYLWRGEIIEALEFWGKVSGAALKEWGMKDPNILHYKDYDVNAWLVGNYIIKCVLNPDPLGRRPYSTASWGRIPKAFWGVGLPEIVRDVQTMCNAAARSLANNMAVASGPQVEVQIDRLPDGEDITSIYPWKIWQTTSDRTGSGQPAVRFFQPSMNASDLMQIYLQFSRQADEVTGIPNYVYGSTQQGGAGRTASGLSMLMDNAAKGIKMAIVNIDEVVGEIVHRYYVHNMMFHPDKYIKGDFKVVTRGALGLIAREHLQQKRNEFLQATANPIDVQITGVEGRAHILREIAAGLNMNTDKIVPDEEHMKMLKGPQGNPEQDAQMQAQMEEMAQLMQQAQQALQQKDQEIQNLTQAQQDKSRELEAKRYEADKRSESEKYKADKTAEAQVQAAIQAAGAQAQATANQPTMQDIMKMLKELIQPAQVTVNQDNSALAKTLEMVNDQLKSSTEGQAKLTESITDKLAKTTEVLAKAVEKASAPKNTTLKIEKGKDGSLIGKRTEE